MHQERPDKRTRKKEAPKSDRRTPQIAARDAKRRESERFREPIEYERWDGYS